MLCASSRSYSFVLATFDSPNNQEENEENSEDDGDRGQPKSGDGNDIEDEEDDDLNIDDDEDDDCNTDDDEDDSDDGQELNQRLRQLLPNTQIVRKPPPPPPPLKASDRLASSVVKENSPWEQAFESTSFVPPPFPGDGDKLPIPDMARAAFLAQQQRSMAQSIAGLQKQRRDKLPTPDEARAALLAQQEQRMVRSVGEFHLGAAELGRSVDASHRDAAEVENPSVQRVYSLENRGSAIDRQRRAALLSELISEDAKVAVYEAIGREGSRAKGSRTPFEHEILALAKHEGFEGHEYLVNPDCVALLPREMRMAFLRKVCHALVRNASFISDIKHVIRCTQLWASSYY